MTRHEKRWVIDVWKTDALESGSWWKRAFVCLVTAFLLVIMNAGCDVAVSRGPGPQTGFKSESITMLAPLVPPGRA